MVENSLALVLSWLLRVIGYRRATIEQNLGIAFPDDSALRARLLPEAYRHLARLILEVLRLLGPWRSYVRARVELRGKEHWEKAKAEGRGVVFLANHVGNWEMMAAGGALAGIPILLVTKHLKPEWLHRAIERGRAKCGVEATYEPRTFRDVLSRLKKGGTVGFVMDQYAGPPVGIRVPFLGAVVGTQSAVAILAKRTGALVLPVSNYRLPDGHFVVEIEPALAWITDEDPEREIAVNTAHYAEVVERHVRNHPGQWLWVHRRFKGDLSPLSPGEWSSGRKYPKLGKP